MKLKKKIQFGAILLTFIVYSTIMVVFGDNIISLGRDVRTMKDKVVLFLFEENNLPVILIQLEQTEVDKLELYRTRANEEGIITKKNKKYVKATLKYKSENLKINLRLKGDNIDHLISDKTSYRIKIKNKKTLLNTAKFSIQNPNTRGYLYEYFTHKVFSDENILTTNYRFINVDINGVDKRIYAFEEHFTDSLLVRYNRAIGGIYCFNENISWSESLIQIQVHTAVHDNETGGFLDAPIKCFSANSVALKYNKQALKVLNSFRKIKSLENFDINLWAKYFALIEVFGGNHGARWHNIRFYFNPITKLMEPIAYDLGHISNSSILHEAFDDHPKENSNEYFLRIFFNNSVFLTQYYSNISKYLAVDYPLLVIDAYNKDEQYSSISKAVELEFPRTNNLRSRFQKRLMQLNDVYNPKNPLTLFTIDNNVIVKNNYVIPIKLAAIRSKNKDHNLDSIYLHPKSFKSYGKEVTLKGIELSEDSRLEYFLLNDPSTTKSLKIPLEVVIEKQR